jgi:uncharacterized membrane protein
MPNLISEASLRSVVDVLVRVVESAGGLVILAGAAIAFVRFVGAAVRTPRAEEFVPVRLGLGRFLALGLEFQLAGDILRTAIAPSFKEIGHLRRSRPFVRASTSFSVVRFVRREPRYSGGTTGTWVTDVLGPLALGLVATGLVAAIAALITTQEWRAALAMALDLWMAAGLLRLSEPPTFGRLATAAALIAIRHLATATLSRFG